MHYKVSIKPIRGRHFLQRTDSPIFLAFCISQSFCPGSHRMNKISGDVPIRTNRLIPLWHLSPELFVIAHFFFQGSRAFNFKAEEENEEHTCRLNPGASAFRRIHFAVDDRFGFALLFGRPLKILPGMLFSLRVPAGFHIRVSETSRNTNGFLTFLIIIGQ
jgi:hypothetical protein